MAVAADGDVGLRPVPADAGDQAVEKLAHLLARRGLAGAQDHSDRSPGRRIVDMDRQKAALIVVRVPLRQLLVAVHDVDRVVDVQQDGPRRLAITLAPDINECVSEANDLAQRRRILPARDGRLRAQVLAAVGQASARQLESRVAAQPVEVVAIGIAAADRQHAGAQHIGNRVCDVRCIPSIGNQSRERSRDVAPTFGKGEQHHASVGGQPASIKRSYDFLARNRWQAEAELIIVGHGGCGAAAWSTKDGLDTHSLRKLNALRHIRQLKLAPG
jgi:hypothetical protein